MDKKIKRSKQSAFLIYDVLVSSLEKYISLKIQLINNK